MDVFVASEDMSIPCVALAPFWTLLHTTTDLVICRFGWWMGNTNNSISINLLLLLLTRKILKFTNWRHMVRQRGERISKVF
jgi:hypothetical protein